LGLENLVFLKDKKTQIVANACIVRLIVLATSLLLGDTCGWLLCKKILVHHIIRFIMAVSSSLSGVCSRRISSILTASFFFSFSYKLVFGPSHFFINPSSYFSFDFVPYVLISICLVLIHFSILFCFHLHPSLIYFVYQI
jgi:hypothetical protein